MAASRARTGAHMSSSLPLRLRAPLTAEVPSTLLLQQSGPWCDDGAGKGWCVERVPLRDEKRPGPSLVPLAPRANIFASSASASLIEALLLAALLGGAASTDSVSLP